MAITIRRDDRGMPDEVLAEDCDVRLECLNDREWSLTLKDKDRTLILSISIGEWSRRRVTVTVFADDKS